MKEEQLEELLNTMLMVDTPISGIARGGILKAIEEGREVKEDWYREHMAVKGSYERIDISRLSDNTGKPVVEKLKPLIKEYFSIFEKLWGSYVANDYRAQKVPERLYEIAHVILNSVPEFDRLTNDTYELYHRAWDVHYFRFDRETSPVSTRTEWFIAGKPTRINKEKLKLLAD
ncbi:MAG: hypothetical protein ABIH37_04800 [archaeon]